MTTRLSMVVAAGLAVAVPLLAGPLLAGPLLADTKSAAAPAQEQAKAHDHDHAHDHGHVHATAGASTPEQIYKGHFQDSEIADRALSDWEGDWQSVYPLLMSGKLDPVMAHKAGKGDKTASEYRAYYETGYRTDVDRIEIVGDRLTFHRGGATATGRYAADGHEVLTYEKGNRGVRFVFRKTEGDAEAPAFVQFSDHIIAPQETDHYHLYWGEDRALLLEELTNWPTYYPAALSAEEVVTEMLAH